MAIQRRFAATAAKPSARRSGILRTTGMGQISAMPQTGEGHRDRADLAHREGCQHRRDRGADVGPESIGEDLDEGQDAGAGQRNREGGRDARRLDEDRDQETEEHRPARIGEERLIKKRLHSPEDNALEGHHEISQRGEHDHEGRDEEYPRVAVEQRRGSLDRWPSQELQRAGEGETANFREQIRHLRCQGPEEVCRHLEREEHDDRKNIEEIVDR